MSFLNLIFILNGKNITMQCQSSELFAEVALRYCQKRGLGENDSPKFFFNSQELKLEAGKTLSDYKMNTNAKVDVVLSSTVIGAI